MIKYIVHSGNVRALGRAFLEMKKKSVGDLSAADLKGKRFVEHMSNFENSFLLQLQLS
jgi:hypothetical protein